MSWDLKSNFHQINVKADELAEHVIYSFEDIRFDAAPVECSFESANFSNFQAMIVRKMSAETIMWMRQ
jgi:hypothetical protein